MGQSLSTVSLLIKRGDRVAVGVGSRGIANIVTIARAAVDKLKALGAHPFVIPVMGSHGGATPEGQLGVLAHYGVAEATMRYPLLATMEVAQVGESRLLRTLPKKRIWIGGRSRS